MCAKRRWRAICGLWWWRIKINTDLERMGDMAVGVVERSLALMRQPELPTGDLIVEIGNLVESMVLTSLDAFVQRDERMARGVIASDDGVDTLRNRITRQMMDLMKTDPSTIEAGSRLYSDRAAAGTNRRPRDEHRRGCDFHGQGNRCPASGAGTGLKPLAYAIRSDSNSGTTANRVATD